MKVAVPTRNNHVDDHFGHCESYTIFTVDDNLSVTNSEILPSPQGCGCKSNIAAVLKQMGVGVMLAGNMGEGAFNVLSYNGIKVYRGCSGEATQVVQEFLKGNVLDSKITCANHHHHNGDHQCGH